MDVFRGLLGVYNCLYAVTARHCSQRVANFVFSFLMIGYQRFYHQYGCDLSDIGKLLQVLVAMKIRHNVDEVMFIDRAVMETVIISLLHSFVSYN